jgi:hypothetical protein
MKSLLAAFVLLAALSASAQTAPAPATLAPPTGTPTGSAPPGTAGLRGGGEGSAEWRGGPRGTLVVVEREDVERRLARMEALLSEALERSRRWEGRGKLNDAYEELRDLREVIDDAPEAPRMPSPRPPPPPPAPVYMPIADGPLQRLVGAVARESFSANKLRVLQESVRDNYFVVGQVQQLLGSFSFAADRLNAVRMLWPRVLDRQNGYQLNSSFTFSKDKEELQRIISG